MQKKVLIIFIAVSITFALLFFGLLFGIIIENFQKNYLEKDLLNIKTKGSEIRLFLNYMEKDVSSGNLDCNFYDESIRTFGKSLNEYGRFLNEYYKKNSELEDVKLLQKDYVISSIDLYLAVEEYNKVCKENYKNIILYFYPYNCGVCDGITQKINNLVNERNDVFEFSIAAEVDLRIVDFIAHKYNLQTIPSLIVNGQLIEGRDSYKDVEKYLK